MSELRAPFEFLRRVMFDEVYVAWLVLLLCLGTFIIGLGIGSLL